jgi:hypothetical protein
MMIEKAFASYVLAYGELPIYKGLSAILLIFNKSITCETYNIIYNIIRDVKFEKATLANFVEWLQSCLTSVKTFKTNPFAGSFMRLVTKLFSLFVCPDIGEYIGSFFSSDIIRKILDMFSTEYSPIESILQFITYICNAVNVFVDTGTMEGFLHTHTSDDSIFDRVVSIRMEYNAFKTGDLEMIRENKNYKLKYDLITLLKDLTSHKKSKKASDVRQLEGYINEVESMLMYIEIKEQQSSVRKQPYSMLLASGSGISKTYLSQVIARVVAKANNIPSDPEYIHNLNQANKFQSNWLNSTTTVMVDDASAMLSTNTVACDLADFLLRSANNAQHELLSADVEMKGKMFNRALINMWNSNSWSLDFQAKARFPSALNRRFQVKIVGDVRPQYRKTSLDGEVVSSMIDYDKIPKDELNQVVLDAWTFKVYKCVIADSGIKVPVSLATHEPEQDNAFYYEIVERDGKKLENISFDELLTFLTQDSIDHFSNQEKVLNAYHKTYDDGNYCDHGIPTGATCSRCHSPPKKITRTFLDNLRRPKLSKDDGLTKGLIKPVFRYDYMQAMWVEDELIPAEPYPAIYKQSLKTRRYLKSLVDSVLEGKFMPKLDSFSDFSDEITLFKTLSAKFLDTIQSWFNKSVFDVLSLLIEKLSNYMEKILKKPYSCLPKSCEGTPMGAIVHARNPIYRLPLIMDYFSYRLEKTIFDFLYWYRVPITCKRRLQLCPEILPSYCERHLIPIPKRRFTFALWVYNKFCKTKSSQELLYEKTLSTQSPMEFVQDFGCKITNLEKQAKTMSPEIFRDTLLPYLGAVGLVGYFIPSFCKSFSHIYVEQQAGHELTPEEIGVIDSKLPDLWYLEKVEKPKTQLDVCVRRNFHELEAAIVKNVIYCENTSNKRSCNVFSPDNGALIFPKHFALEAKDDVIKLVRRPLTLNKATNNTLEFKLVESMFYDLGGDLMLVYAPQTMDHSRTKNIMDCIVKSPALSTSVSSTLYRDKNGNVVTYHATQMEFMTGLDNECLQEGEVPKNPFDGYRGTGDNFFGMCGSPVIDVHSKNSAILGIHVGGNVASRICVSQAISYDEIKKAISSFCGKEGIMKQMSPVLKAYGKVLEVSEPYRNNPFYGKQLPNVELLGSLKQRVTPVAKVVYTPIAEDVRKSFKIDYRWKAPDFKFNNDKRHGVNSLIRSISSKSVFVHHTELSKAVTDYSIMIRSAFNSHSDFWKEEIRLLNDFEIVNGVPGKKFLGGMKMNSKCSPYLPGKKSDHATLQDGYWVLEPYIWDEFNRRESTAKSGEFTPELCTQSLKNEATPIEKVEAGKVRSFFMYDIATQMLLRKYLLTTCRFWCLNTSKTECAVGINPHSTDWDTMYAELETFPNVIALDFKNFDLGIPYEVFRDALDILFIPLEMSQNFDVEMSRIVANIKHLLLNTLCDVSGELVVLMAILASGTNVTSILGCIINAIYNRMVYYKIYPNIRELFAKYVCLRTFGDDVIGSVHKSLFKLNVKNMITAFNEMGIRATDMHKQINSKVEFYNVNVVEFLKRTGEYNKDFGFVVAPLLLKSLFKMLSCHVPSRSMSIEAITGQCVDNFLLEAKFLGRAKYEEFREKISTIMVKHQLTHYCSNLDKDYDQMVSNWKEKYKSEGQITKLTQRDRMWIFRHFFGFNSDHKTWFGWTQINNNNNKIETRTPGVLKGEVVEELAQIYKQSSENETEKQKQQVMTFVGPKEDETLMIGGEMPLARDFANDTSIAEFLKRPVKIATFEWGASIYNAEINPWELLLTNKAISNRMCNYMLFRGRCKVKFLVNGNPFYYGRLMVSYVPFFTRDSFIPKSHLPLAGHERYLITLSQCPSIYINPTSSTGGEISLPFFWPQDYIELADVPADRELGQLVIRQMVPLKHVNRDISATLDTITVSVFAWFEDVDVQASTQGRPEGISAQSSRENETVNKPVSQAATTVASLAKVAAEVPVIGPYASAIEKAATLTSAVASSLGYSKPEVTTEPSMLVPKADGYSACTNTVSDCFKLTTDIKQEITIDPRTVGLGDKDELSIAYIAQIESYFGSFTWSTDNPTETVKYSTQVTPTMYDEDTSANTYMTAMCGAAIPFLFWTGDLIWRFSVVCSDMHRGRLAIVYDPFSGYGTRQDNAAYTEIIDISETKDFEVRISPQQSTLWKTIPINWNNVVYYRADGNVMLNSQFGNGVLSVYVLNRLTTPASDPTLNTDVKVQVYVRAAENFRVSVPTSGISRHSCISPQSSNPPDELVAHETSYDGNLDKLYMGERIDSFRNLLKRPNMYQVIFRDPTVQDRNRYHYFQNTFPQYRGGPDDVNGTTGSGNNLVFTLMNHLMSAFSGFRGSVRHRMIMIDPDILYCSLGRSFESGSDSWLVSATPTSRPAANSWDHLAVPTRSAQMGAAYCVPKVNPILEANFPFYSRRKFIHGRPKRVSEAEYSEKAMLSILYLRDGAVPNRSVAEHYISAGEDFTCFFFCGWAPLNMNSGG